MPGIIQATKKRLTLSRFKAFNCFSFIFAISIILFIMLKINKKAPYLPVKRVLFYDDSDKI